MFPPQAVELIANTPAPVGFVATAPARTRRAPPRPSCKVKVDAAIIQEGEAKLDAMITNLGLVKPAMPYDPFAKLTVHKDASTVACYQRLWIEMRKFFYSIGCIQSAMLVDRHRCPTKPLPFRPESFALYLDYRMGTAGDPLLQPGSNSQPVLDIRGNPLSIIGGWDSPASCYKIHSAVLFLHEVAYSETCGGPYVTNCVECERMNQHLGAQLQGDGSSTSITTNPVQMIEEEDEEAASASALNNLSQSLGLFRSCISHANAPNLRTKGNILSNPATVGCTFVGYFSRDFEQKSRFFFVFFSTAPSNASVFIVEVKSARS
jgi:hypothetical protein